MDRRRPSPALATIAEALLNEHQVREPRWGHNAARCEAGEDGAPVVNPDDQPVSWGRSVVDPTHAHVRQIRDGAVVVHEVEGHRVGFAVCGAWLLDDCADPAESDEVAPCSVCLDMLNKGEFTDWER